jgi:large subunit ribosomal protein L7/L12
MPLPQAENNSTEEKVYPGKITQIVDQIAHLNLLEVADLNELLKHRLNITDAPVMMAGNFSGGVGAAAPAEEDQEEEAPVAVQSSFTVHLEAFDAGKKVALIKELKNQLEGMNLVQAKKFVESAPAVVKADMSKDEAEALKKALVEAGGTCKID